MKRVYEAASFSLLMLLIFTTFICGLNYGKIKKLQDGQVVLAAAVKELQKGSKSLGAERYVELVKRGANFTVRGISASKMDRDDLLATIVFMMDNAELLPK